MIRRVRMFLWICVSFLMTSCNSVVSQNVSNQMAALNQQPRQNIVEVSSNVTDKVSSLWKVSTYKVGSKESLQVLYFFDSDNGWTASSEGSLYRTANGGKTWQKVNINISKGARVSGIFFVNPAIGWITVRKTAPNILDYEANQSWIMKTDNGGQSWTTQHTGKAIGLGRIIFVNEQEGWAAGIKTIGLSPLRQVHYVLHTKNQGESWTDVSEELNRVAANEDGRVYDQTTDLYATNPSNLTLLSLRGKVFSTNDGGKTWRNIVNLPDEPGQTCICRIGILSDDSLWVSGGAKSREGTWGMIGRKANNNPWTRYRTAGIYFRDALYISENQVLASGSTSSNGVSNKQHKDKAVILYSSDGGLNWTYLYNNAEVENIHALHAIDSAHIWAVGDNGLALYLERTKE